MKLITSKKRWNWTRKPIPVFRFLLALLLLVVFASGVTPVRADITAGTFAPKVDYPSNLSPTGVVLGDLDGDAKPDIATSQYGNLGNGSTVSVFRNTGTGTTVSFAAKVDFTTAAGPHGIAIGDLDKDGKLDLVTANYGPGGGGTSLSILRNISTVGNIAFAPTIDMTTGTGPVNVVAGDVDGDTKLDLMVTYFDSGNGNTVAIFRNVSSVGSISFAAPVNVITNPGPYGIAFGDVDGDVKSDLAIGNFGAQLVGDGNTISVFLNQSTPGTISFASKMDFATDAGARQVVLSDLDGDGKNDMAAPIFGAGGMGTTISVFRNTSTTGSISFAARQTLAAGTGPLDIQSGDFDQDGSPDLAVTNYGVSYPQTPNLGTTISVFDNTSTSGSISFATKVDFTVNPGPHAAAVGDLNADTKLDLAVVSAGEGAGTMVSVLQNITGLPTNTPTDLPPSGDFLFDDFPGSALSSSWSVVTNGAPTISGSIATFDTGNTIASNAAIANSSVFEIRAQYSSSSFTGLCWTNLAITNYVCWVPLSTNTSHFAFFTSDGGEVDSGVLVPSGYHSYAISRNGALFTVYIDGSPAYSATDSAVSVDHVYLSGYGGFAVDWSCAYAIGSSCQGGDLLFDHFPGSVLSSSWSVPFNAAPAVTGGIATFDNGDTIVSNDSFGNPTVFEIRAQYSLSPNTGLCWANAGGSEHACWVPLSANTSHFAFLTNDGGEVDSGVSIPSGYHRYGISRNGTVFTVYLDGVPVYSTTDSAVSVNHAYLSGYGDFVVDWACVYPVGSSCQEAGTTPPTSTPTPTITPTNTPTSTPTPTATSTPIPTGDLDTTGVFRPTNGLLYLKNSNDTGFADAALNYGLPGDYPVVGDWDGNGTVTIGIYRNGSFFLRNSNTLGFAEIVFPFGQPGDQPIAGDWDGNGVDTIGIYRPSNGQFLLRNSNTEGPSEASFFLGNVGDVGVAGDWNGDGKDTTGVFRPSNGVIFLKDTNDTGFADYALNYGLPGDQPVMGDWNNDGKDTIGIYRTGTFFLRNENTNGFAEIVFGLGNPGDMPIAGNWDNLP